MRIGVPTEIKNHEYRVALTPAGVRELTGRGHHVQIQAGAGAGSLITDDEYAAAGARLVSDAWADADLVMKVKEPIEPEYARMREGQILFTYLHLAADKRLTDELLTRGVTGVAYETVQQPDGSLPLLAPMSEVAGRLAPQVGAQALMRAQGGRGVLMGGVPGVAPARVVIIGGGVSGLNAATVAHGMGADVTVLDLSVDRLREIDRLFRGAVRTVTSSSYEIEQAVVAADLVIGAVLIPGAKAPTLVGNDLVKRMRPGSVLVDIAIDQGGCFADSRPTTHDDPTYRVHDSVFYCVANMPGAVARTSTMALTNVTLPYALALAGEGLSAAMTADRSLAAGLNTHRGLVTNAGVAEATGIPHTDVHVALAQS
ncbi:alanine dehydrogenase [Actinoplanes sp. RD1]|uniref:alanine dehydrogenase n=1 Tax=Actinoplanes sp. RD1 TaxID=3064538 RepID=UPI0027412F3F|nr:alanine dehydrogenase [Actinoplanes sp. RD1]